MEAIEVEQDLLGQSLGGAIRAAAERDLAVILEYGARFHEHSKQPFPFDPAATENFLRIMIKNDDAQIFVSDTGMIGGVLTPAYCAPNWVMAVELFWWAEKGGLKLLKAFEDWAKDMDANEVRMTSLAALERADGLLKRKSYTPTEISYRKLV